MTLPEDSHGFRTDEFSREASRTRTSFLSDYLYLLRNNRKWWMLPLLGLLLILGMLTLLSSSGVAPLIYTLF
jgi:hypothetical protein